MHFGNCLNLQRVKGRGGFKQNTCSWWWIHSCWMYHRVTGSQAWLWWGCSDDLCKVAYRKTHGRGLMLSKCLHLVVTYSQQIHYNLQPVENTTKQQKHNGEKCDFHRNLLSTQIWLNSNNITFIKEVIQYLLLGDDAKFNNIIYQAVFKRLINIKAGATCYGLKRQLIQNSKVSLAFIYTLPKPIERADVATVVILA